jgi:hypothetical protein
VQRDHGVDLRLGVSVEALEGDAAGHVRRARLSDKTTIDVDVVVASLGSIRNIEWLEGAGLATGFWGVACDAGCRAFDVHAHLRRGRRRARAPRALRVRVARTLGQCGLRGRGRGAQHGEPRARPSAAPPASRLLVGPVRRQHQGRRYSRSSCSAAAKISSRSAGLSAARASTTAPTIKAIETIAWSRPRSRFANPSRECSSPCEKVLRIVVAVRWDSRINRSLRAGPITQLAGRPCCGCFSPRTGAGFSSHFRLPAAISQRD